MLILHFRIETTPLTACRGGGGALRGGPPNRYNDRGGHSSRDMRDRNRDYRDRRDPSGGGKMPDRRGDRDDKGRPKSMVLFF